MYGFTINKGKNIQLWIYVVKETFQYLLGLEDLIGLMLQKLLNRILAYKLFVM